MPAVVHVCKFSIPWTLVVRLLFSIPRRRACISALCVASRFYPAPCLVAILAGHTCVSNLFSTRHTWEISSFPPSAENAFSTKRRLKMTRMEHAPQSGGGGAKVNCGQCPRPAVASGLGWEVSTISRRRAVSAKGSLALPAEGCGREDLDEASWWERGLHKKMMTIIIIILWK